MSWNKDTAVEYARNNAGSASQRRCAHFVSNAIRAGGARLHNTNHAKNMGPNLYAAGFREVSGAPMKGDIAVIQPIPGHPSGHACIYDGHGTWYSDFVQHTMYPGSSWRAATPPYQLYRHN
ncbi:CHAP domain-containing protein [Salmonella enterica subsp. houtenae]|uniref:CHAP domain-containing protein n=1 Tax=Salmonella houtenae TaxID=59205 RepID=A0A5Y2SK36_SALHO|nr:CHAP domain-containing protein [Salmonella enterica]ECF6076206.1 CHAP domain-containing protein [Salmonella enterica subsp. houtenae]